MFKNYFKTAWRSLLKNKMTTIVNLSGLTLGIVCFLVLATYILNELKYDRFYDKANRIAFVSFHYKSASDFEPVLSKNTPTGLAPAAKREIPQVEDAVRIYKYGKTTVSNDSKLFSEKNIFMADESFFNIFGLPFIEGNPQTALKNPNSLVITKTIAEKYFNKEPALGKSLKLGTHNWLVTGVIADVPTYSTLQFDMLGSYCTLPRSKTEQWGSANDISFLLLKNPDDFKEAGSGITAYIKKRFPEGYESGNSFGFNLEPLTSIHLYSKALSQGNIYYLYVLGAVALLLLLIACINFTNLITAKSIERVKEIGVRKTFGADRKNIFIQFISESATITFIAVVLGVGLTFILLPVFNVTIGLQLNLNIWNIGIFILMLMVLLILVTFVAGAWPAVVMSKFRPALVLKDAKMRGGNLSLLRKILVAFQFTISIAFIIATIIVQRQMYFIQHADTGIDRSQIVVLDGNQIGEKRLAVFKSELLKNSFIKNVSASYDSPVSVGGGYTINIQGRNDKYELSVMAIPVDIDYIKTLGIKIAAGTDFTNTDELSVKDTAESKRVYAFMLNRSAVKALGLTPETAINKPVNMNGRQGVIKAVLEDFNFASLKDSIQPIVVFPEYEWFGEVLIKTSTAQANVAITQIQKTWKNLFPELPFEYRFLNDDYNSLYKAEHKTGVLLNIFSIATIFISCLGLFALSAFEGVTRTKEIGVRKVLGASVISIVGLVSKGFIKLILIAVVIASGLAWWIMNQWLQGFAYRVSIEWWVFVLSGFTAIVVALATIGYQTIKAAIANPAKSLRSE